MKYVFTVLSFHHFALFSSETTSCHIICLFLKKQTKNDRGVNHTCKSIFTGGKWLLCGFNNNNYPITRSWFLGTKRMHFGISIHLRFTVVLFVGNSILIYDQMEQQWSFNRTPFTVSFLFILPNVAQSTKHKHTITLNLLSPFPVVLSFFQQFLFFSHSHYFISSMRPAVIRQQWQAWCSLDYSPAVQDESRK